MAVNLLAILESTGLPVTYLQWGDGQAPQPPYIVYLAEGSRNLAADNIVYIRRTNYLIELYSDYQESATEQLIRDALTAAGIYYDTTETWIEAERLYQVVFSVQI